jgi:hypothetical protein
MIRNATLATLATTLLAATPASALGTRQAASTRDAHYSIHAVYDLMAGAMNGRIIIGRCHARHARRVCPATIVTRTTRLRFATSTTQTETGDYLFASELLRVRQMAR